VGAVPPPQEHLFTSRDEASREAAAFIAGAIGTAVADNGRAALVVSGGTSPVACFDYLAGSPLAWSRVQVLLSDERWVPADDEASNEKLVREHLLKGPAAAASLLGVYAEGRSPAARCAELNTAYQSVPRPFACALLGMGSDGHFASLFPDAENLAVGLDVATRDAFLPVSTAASPHPRVSMSLPALLDSRAILLLIFGADKRNVCAGAAAGTLDVPVAALLRQQCTPVHVFWAG
jgi:6-phosphogluconolactonase